MAFLFNTHICLSYLAVLNLESQQWLLCGLWKAASSLVEQDKSHFQFVLSITFTGHNSFTQKAVHLASRKGMKQGILLHAWPTASRRSQPPRHSFRCLIVECHLFCFQGMGTDPCLGYMGRGKLQGPWAFSPKTLRVPCMWRGIAQPPFWSAATGINNYVFWQLSIARSGTALDQW